jgi:hypothetical protein
VLSYTPGDRVKRLGADDAIGHRVEHHSAAMVNGRIELQPDVIAVLIHLGDLTNARHVY